MLFLKKYLYLSHAPIEVRAMPPPCCCIPCHHNHSAAGSFLRDARFGFGFSSTVTTTSGAAGLAEFTLFNLALIAFLLLETPYEPIEILPLLDFLSPFPM